METRIQTILIIENAPLVDEEFKSILGKDFLLLFANGAEDALELACQKGIDLVLLDNNTPGVEVGEIYSRLSENAANRYTQIILIVNKNQECLPAGVADCIDKPLQPAIVMARLQRHLELKGYRDLGEESAVDFFSVGGSQKEFDFLLGREWKRALRNQTPISLVLIGVDFFKEYEVHEGRLVGNACLRLVGEALRACIKRDLDFIALDETGNFICLLPDTDMDGVRRICQLIKEKVAQLNIPHPCSSIADHVTVSMGTATVRPTFKLSEDCLLHQAEILLEQVRNHSHS